MNQSILQCLVARVKGRPDITLEALLSPEDETVLDHIWDDPAPVIPYIVQGTEGLLPLKELSGICEIMKVSLAIMYNKGIKKPDFLKVAIDSVAKFRNLSVSEVSHWETKLVMGYYNKYYHGHKRKDPKQGKLF